MEHRYTLASNKALKLNCPYCGAKKHWQRYIDIETGEVLPDHWGRCDNQDKCRQWNDPYKDGYAKEIWKQEQKVTGVTKVTVPKQKYFFTQPKPQPTPEPVFFDFETFRQTLQHYEKNTFIQNLFYSVQFPFEVNEVTKVVQLYRLGTVANGYRAGANTFPFIDITGNVRAVQVKQFDEANHTTGTDFLHSIIEKQHAQNNKPLPEWLEAYTKQDKKISCLFGEHLLGKYHSNPVALVEAPKTAVYGTLYFGFPETPEDLIWLAVYNKSSFSFDKLKVLQGRFVYVFPDLSKDGNTFKEWETKAKEYEGRLNATRFIFSDLLERLATPEQKEQGSDIADVLIKQDWRQFRNDKYKDDKLHKLHTIKKEGKEDTRQKFNELNTLKKGTDKDTALDKLDESDTLKKGMGKVSELDKLDTLKKGVNKNDELHKLQSLKKEGDDWSNQITEIEDYFKSIEIPTQPVKINSYSTITDCKEYIKAHITIVKANNGKETFLPHLNRLHELRQFLTTSPNQ
ncbi:MAG: hypothetical protein UZ09_BCD002000061 [Bacteroidetes bacterium OLB9]|nr:MAG: hypothetical protein UZ09_BCD002000061 [Bacteroidetes bacterium OLB9]